MSNTVESAMRVSRQANARAFDAWSRSYDRDANPLLMLEERYLETLLPDISGRAVLDAGCGTGRWLRRLAGMHSRTLHGIDTSSAMLTAARRNGIGDAELHRCSCDTTPFRTASFDVVLVSFVLCYLPDIDTVAAEFTRVACDGCDLILTDMHPETEQRLNWRRSFRTGGVEVHLKSMRRSLDEIVRAFVPHGWRLVAAVEPAFDVPEREIFVSAGKLRQFSEAAALPAIYILHLRKLHPRHSNGRSNRRLMIRGARCAFGPTESATASLQIAGGRFSGVLPPRFANVSKTAQEIDLTGHLVMPGLVNAHDHLEFALFPRLGGGTYANVKEWATDIHERLAGVIALHKRVPLRTRLWWGALRNLLSGVTTVCHHNPSNSELARRDFPVRVVRDVRWAHSLAFDHGIRAVHAAEPRGSPFMVHACEGTDETARLEVAELDRIGVLDANTVIIHGLGLDRQGALLLRLRGTRLVLCPSSNLFLFGKIPDMEIIGGAATAIGSDSPLTARGDLLDEARFAIECCHVPPARAWRMITDKPARFLRSPHIGGSLRTGSAADLIAIRDTFCNVSERLRTITAADIELVIVGGRVHLASPAMLQRLSEEMKAGLEPLCLDGIVRWLRAPVRRLLSETEAILGSGQVTLGNKPVRAMQDSPDVNY